MLKKNIKKFYLVIFTALNIQNIQSFFCCKEDTTKNRQVKRKSNSTENNSNSALVALMRENKKKNCQNFQEDSSIQNNQQPTTITIQNQIVAPELQSFTENQKFNNDQNFTNNCLVQEATPSNLQDRFYFVPTLNESEDTQGVFSPQENSDSNFQEMSNNINNFQGQLPYSAVQSTTKFPFYRETTDSNSQQILTIRNNDSISQEISRIQKNETRRVQTELPSHFVQSSGKIINQTSDLDDHNVFIHNNSGSRHLPGAKTKSSDSPQSLTPTNLSPNEKPLHRASNFKNYTSLSLMIESQPDKKQKLPKRYTNSAFSTEDLPQQDLPHTQQTNNEND